MRGKGSGSDSTGKDWFQYCAEGPFSNIADARGPAPANTRYYTSFNSTTGRWRGSYADLQTYSSCVNWQNMARMVSDVVGAYAVETDVDAQVSLVRFSLRVSLLLYWSASV